MAYRIDVRFNVVALYLIYVLSLSRIGMKVNCLDSPFECQVFVLFLYIVSKLTAPRSNFLMKWGRACYWEHPGDTEAHAAQMPPPDRRLCLASDSNDTETDP